MIAQAMGVKPPSGVGARSAVSPAGSSDDPSFRWHRQESNPQIDAEVQKAIASTKPAFLSDQPRAVDVFPVCLDSRTKAGWHPQVRRASYLACAREMWQQRSATR